MHQSSCRVPKKGYWCRPTIFTGVSQSSRVVQEEIFGPVLAIQTFRRYDEALIKANNTPYGLSGGIWTDKGSKIFKMTQGLRAGIVWANTFNKFDPTSPFGGYKESGVGREGGLHGLDAYVKLQGSTAKAAKKEVDLSIDRLIYYAGWADKYQQVFSAVNPVASSHFNFSVLEPTGVVSILSPDDSSLLGLITNVAAAIVGGNTCVVLASESKPLCAVSFAEVLHASDVPGGVVNILTGFRTELTEFFASHMDVNAVVYCDGGKAVARTVQELAADNIKRVVARNRVDWSADAENPYLIRDTQEVKTTWHPIGT